MTSREPELHLYASRVANQLRQRHLELPASILLEAGRPLALVVSQLLWLAQPMMGLLMPHRDVSKAAELLENPESVALLLELLSHEQRDQAADTKWIS